MTAKILTTTCLLALCSVAASCQAERSKKLDPLSEFKSDYTLMMADFDGPNDIDQIFPERDEAVTLMSDGREGHKLALFLSSKNNTDQIAIQPKSIWDISSYTDHNIAFDVENIGDLSTQLYVILEDPSGNRESRSISLPANYSGTVFFPITGSEARQDIGMWGLPPVWDTNDLQMVWRSTKKKTVDPFKIAKFEFVGIGLINDREVHVDNIRLRPNPERSGDWLVGLTDKFGQNARLEFPLKVSSEEELKSAADAELIDLAKNTGPKDRSRFGGFKDGPKLDATGYFRVEKYNGKWWMVDPEGYLFYSHGPANVRMANMTTATGIDFKDPSVRIRRPEEVTPEDSMGIVKVSDAVRATRYVANEMRHNMFEWLPDYDDDLADHYSYRRSTHIGPVPHGETYSFYRANLERRYGQTSPESYIKKWEEVTLDRMKSWGFTSFGNWVDPAFYQNERVPYFANGWIIGDFKTLQPLNPKWSPMPDFYDPVFRERAEATISVIAEEVKASPWCVGIFVDNEKAWGETEGSVEARYGIITDALSKNALDSPAKAAFTAHLKEKYGTIVALNAAWNTEFADWQAFSKEASFTEYTDAQVADISSLLEMLGDQYFRVVTETLEQYLPNHLYMGARMANWGMPQEIIKSSVKYSDALSFNIYEEGVQTDHWAFLEEIDLPVVIGEFHIGSVEGSGLYNPGIVHAANQTDRARAYKAYMQTVLDNPYFVGAHWFQYMDEPLTGRTYDGENANIGFVNVADRPYPELVNAAKEVNETLYSGRLQ